MFVKCERKIFYLFFFSPGLNFHLPFVAVRNSHFCHVSIRPHNFFCFKRWNMSDAATAHARTAKGKKSAGLFVYFLRVFTIFFYSRHRTEPKIHYYLCNKFTKISLSQRLRGHGYWTRSKYVVSHFTERASERKRARKWEKKLGSQRVHGRIFAVFIVQELINRLMVWKRGSLVFLFWLLLCLPCCIYVYELDFFLHQQTFLLPYRKSKFCFFILFNSYFKFMLLRQQNNFLSALYRSDPTGKYKTLTWMFPLEAEQRPASARDNNKDFPSTTDCVEMVKMMPISEIPCNFTTILLRVRVLFSFSLLTHTHAPKMNGFQ